MKQTYINPELIVVKLQTQQMLATSQLNIGNPVTTAEGAESREFDYEDEEEEYEDY